jgi:hypothetical protein
MQGDKLETFPVIRTFSTVAYDKTDPLQFQRILLRTIPHLSVPLTQLQIVNHLFPNSIPESVAETILRCRLRRSVHFDPARFSDPTYRFEIRDTAMALILFEGCFRVLQILFDHFASEDLASMKFEDKVRTKANTLPTALFSFVAAWTGLNSGYIPWSGRSNGAHVMVDMSCHPIFWKSFDESGEE